MIFSTGLKAGRGLMAGMLPFTYICAYGHAYLKLNFVGL